MAWFPQEVTLKLKSFSPPIKSSKAQETKADVAQLNRSVTVIFRLAMTSTANKKPAIGLPNSVAIPAATPAQTSSVL